MRLLLALTACALLAACAHTAARVTWQPLPADTIAGPAFVAVEPGPALPPDSARFESRLLDIVRERDPKAELVYGNETSAALSALNRGARLLLVATVLLW